MIAPVPPAWDEALVWDERMARLDAGAVERLQQAKTFRHRIAVYTGGLAS